MVHITNKAMCSGCGACRDICPQKAIRLIADVEGFLYPEVDMRACVKCGRCDMVCPIRKSVERSGRDFETLAYAAQTKDEFVRKYSSSGGIFYEIASHVLAQGGVVFGAAFDETFKVSHLRVKSIGDLNKLCSSKYVQSEIGNTYLEARECLDSGKMVLFTGTPCQIYGLYNYLGKDYKDLYTQDIICHGVPSPMVWQKYIEYREKKAESKIRTMSFRNKRYGWNSYAVQFEFENGAEYLKAFSDDEYMRSFLKNLCLRPSCYECAFKTKERVSDFTLADFWGVDKVCPELNDNGGTSLVIIHSPKGQHMFDALYTKFNSKKVDFEDAIQYNFPMVSSVPINRARNEFIQSVCDCGFEKPTKIYLTIPLKEKLKKYIKKVIGWKRFKNKF